MTELGPILARLGIEQYLDSFIVEGFDTWETVLDVQEGDLDALNVKLGHRRKLQREIANHRGVLYEQSIGSPITEASGEGGKLSDGSPTPTAQHERTGTETKRKYRRHPKPDKNAPERPPSAYVIFSNQIRDEVRGHNLSFTDIAKLVGDRWQRLTSEDKEPFESQATIAKEKFNVELAQYKKTDAYREHTNYIAEFKAKHSASTIQGKRPKLEPDSNSGSGSSRSTEVVVEARPKVSMAHTRDISIGSVNSTSYHGSASSPIGGAAVLSPSVMSYGMSPHQSRGSTTTKTNTTPLRSNYRESRTPQVLSVHASVAADVHQMRSELPDLHSRAGKLSLAHCPSTATLPMTGSADPAVATQPSAAFPAPLLQHHSSVSSVAHSDSSGASNAPPITPADEPWRLQAVDGKAKSARIYNPLLTINYSTPYGSLPPLQSSERIPEIIRDPSQRTLPLPAPSSPQDLKNTFRAHSRNLTSLSPSEPSSGNLSELYDIKSPLDYSENEAANALAVLAYPRG